MYFSKELLRIKIHNQWAVSASLQFYLRAISFASFSCSSGTISIFTVDRKQ